MNILMANLKIFYQRRGMWFWYVFVLLMGGPVFVVSEVLGQGGFAGYLFFSFFLAIFTADLHKDILAKPFAFCMPGYRAVMRRLVIGIGCISNLLLGMIFFWHPGLEFSSLLLVILAAGSLGMIVYLSGVWFTFSLKHSTPVAAIFPLIFFTAMLSGYLKPIDDIIVLFPGLLVVAGILVCGFAWKWLGRESLARKYCGENLIGFANIWDISKRQELWRKKGIQRLAKKESSESDRAGDFFIAMMKKNRALSGSRYAMGSFYILFGRVFGPWWKLQASLFIVSVIVFVPMFGYMSGIFGINAGAVIYLVPAFGLANADLIPYRSLLLPGGRAEKYWSAMSVGFAITVLATLLAMAAAMLTVPLSEVMPEITFRGKAYAFEAFDVRGFHISLLLAPIALVVGTLSSGKSPARLGFMFFVMMFMQLWINPTFSEWFDPLLLIGVPGIMALVAASWISFVLTMGYYCRKRSLVGQGR